MRPVVALALILAGYAKPPASALHYQLGPAYAQGGVWHYPREEFSHRETGLAMVTSGAGGRAALTADGELFDAGVLAASHPTLQLPALARLTNLDNGRSVLVRINDRGPALPQRSLGVTRRTAELLGAADPSAIAYQLDLVEDESRAMANALRPESRLEMASAPAALVQSESLAAPAGVTQAATQVASRAAPQAPAAAPASAPAVPLRLPEEVTQYQARAHDYVIQCAAFSRADYANLLRARLQSLGAVTITDYAAPRDRAYVVRIPGIATVAAADALLAQARTAGATDARIVVD